MWRRGREGGLMRMEGAKELGASDREGVGAEDVVPQKGVEGVD